MSETTEGLQNMPTDFRRDGVKDDLNLSGSKKQCLILIHTHTSLTLKVKMFKNLNKTTCIENLN